MGRVDKLESKYQIEVLPKAEHEDLRWYQKETVDVLKTMESKGNYSTLVVLPTGAGKTTVAVDYITKQAINKKNKVLWLAHRENLLNQAHSSLSKDSSVSRIPDRDSYSYLIVSNNNSNLSELKEDTDILFCTTQTICGALSENKSADFIKWLNASQSNGGKLFIVLDEAHHIAARTTSVFFEQLFNCHNKTDCLWGISSYAFIGVTATPIREDRSELDLYKWFKDGYNKDTKNYEHNASPLGDDGAREDNKGKLVIKGSMNNKIALVDIKDLIKKDVLVEPDFIRVDEFKDNDKSDVRIIDSLADKIMKTPNLGKTVVFVTTRDLAKSLNARLGARSIVCISNNENADDTTDVILDNFRDSKNIDILITVDIISEGFDYKELNTIILVSPTHSRTILRQRIGRVLRSIKDKSKDARVIWYYFDRNDDKSGVVATKSSDSFNLTDIQDEDSKKRDIDRKTYYLTAPSYIEPLIFKTDFSIYDRREIRTLLDILSLFTNKDLKEFIGYYTFDIKETEHIIYVNETLKEGFLQLYRRIRTDYLLNESVLHSYNAYKDFFANKWGITNSLNVEETLLKEIKEICFYLSNPKSKVFNVKDSDIRFFINYVLGNKCIMPLFFVKEAELIKAVEDILDKNKDGRYPIEEDIDTLFNKIIEALPIDYRNVEDSAKEVIQEQIKITISEYITRKSKELEQESLDIEDKTYEAIAQLEEEGNILSDAEKENIGVNILLKKLIDKKSEEVEIKYSSRVKEKAHTKTFRTEKNGLINSYVEDLKYAIQDGVVPMPMRITVTCDKCNKERPLYNMVFNKQTKKGVCSKCSGTGIKDTVYSSKEKFNYTNTIMAQSILDNTHHLVVSEADNEEFTSCVAYAMNYYNVSLGTDQLTQLVGEIVCALGLKNGDHKKYLELFTIEGNKIPRLFAYVVYDIVYKAIWGSASFNKNGVPSAFCQTEYEMRSKEETILFDLGLTADFFSKYELDPVADAINDYRPYRKIIQSYQGIKPDLLCRMLNFILDQLPDDYNHYITACGGSGADIINKIHITDKKWKETYNDIGLLNSTFYKVLQNEDEYNNLVNLLEEFISYIVGYSSSANSFVKFFRNIDIKVERIEEARDEENKKKIQKAIDRRDKIVNTINKIRNQKDDKIGAEYRANSLMNAVENTEQILRGLKLQELFDSQIDIAIRSFYTEKYGEGEVDNTKAYEKGKAAFVNQMILRENALHGVWEKCSIMYSQYQSEVNKDNLDDYEKAFIFFIYLSFPDRQMFDNCFIDKFITFAASYKYWLEMGRERVKYFDVQNEDVIKLLVSPEYNKKNAVVYADIPYSETDDDTYFIDGFDEAKFLKALNNYKGKYIVSSRYNICANNELKSIYYGVKDVEDEQKFYSSDDAKKLKTKVNTIEDFYKAFSGGGRMIKEEGEKTEKEVVQISNIDNQAKYIIMPYADVEEKKNKFELDGMRKGLLHNNYALTYHDVESMFKRTIFSNIPVEVMVTNIDLKKDRDIRLLNAYDLGDGIRAVPTVVADASSTGYHAQPIYLVIEYSKYLELQNLAIHGDEIEEQQANEDRVESVNIFRDFFSKK